MGASQGKPVVFTDAVNLNHFRLLRVVGKGAFGKVRIVERKDSGSTYALKYIRKDEVVRSESVRNIIRERRMLEHLNHPFLVNLRYSFQDVEYLYLVVDLMTGGDLRFHISRKTFTEEAVRFWVAELGCALRYIHAVGIVHRDVKPDNILLDGDGHVHLADFNVASEIRPGKELSSRSGTLAYLAPEVYEGKGYRTEVDWWSLGVVFYECIYNKRPFEANNHEQLAMRIVKAEPRFPVTNPPVSQVCLHAISSLLEKDKRHRIGAKSWHSFYDNPFFRDIDFGALERKEYAPIFLPSSEKTNFDATYDLEELLLEEQPLEARARRQKPREALKHDASQAEIRNEELHRMIETLFEPFDFTLAQYDQTEMGGTGTHTPTSIPDESISYGGYNNEMSRQMRQAQSSVSLHVAATQAMSVTPAKQRSRASTKSGSPNGSPPMPEIDFNNLYIDRPPPEPPRSVPNYYPAQHHHNMGGGPGGFAGPAFDSDYERAGKRRRAAPASPIDATAPPLINPADYHGDLVATLSPVSTTSNDENNKPNNGGAGGAVLGKKPSGMLGFLSRKKGRSRSPKPKERGVIGKEGARVVVNS